jgi:hypothetical protein
MCTPRPTLSVSSCTVTHLSPAHTQQHQNPDPCKADSTSNRTQTELVAVLLFFRPVQLQGKPMLEAGNTGWNK